MKSISTHHYVVALGLVFITTLALAAADATDAVRVVPVTEEPGHIVRYQSPHFLIYTNRLMPGYQTLYHEHRNDLLAVIAGDTIAVNQKPDGQPTEQKVPAGTVILFPYADLPKAYVHRVSVAGELPFINVGLEFLDAWPIDPRRSQAPLLNAAGIIVLNENRRGRAYRVDLAPGVSLALPEQGSGLLIVALKPLVTTLETKGTASRWEPAQGDFRFFETTWPQRISNLSAGIASLVVFQAF